MERLRAVIDEHKALRARVASLRALAAARAGAEWARRLEAALYDLFVALDEHFALEEKAGLFDRLAALLPEAGPDCAQLRAEHAGLLSRLDALRDRLAAGLPVGAGRDVKREVLALLDDLGRHESRENELASRAALGQEVGVAD